VPSARRFYFFIRSVRAFGTTQSLLFISFTKPSMTTLPSENSIVGMDPMATHCRKLIVTGIYQANVHQKFVMSYTDWHFVPKSPSISEEEKQENCSS
jgi:hypothetical protein